MTFKQRSAAILTAICIDADDPQPDIPENQIYDDGNHVALSADGNIAFVTGETAEVDWVNQEASLLSFQRTGTTWHNINS